MGPRYKDLTGQIFGRLTVIKLHSTIDYKSHARWLCRCICGNEKLVYSSNLLRGDTQSCGCFRRELITLPEGESSFNELLRDYARHAKETSRAFNLTREQFRILTKQNCFYCGAPPSQTAKTHSSHSTGKYLYTGVDRINNEVGYTLENCVPCCGRCNKMKQSFSSEEFITACFRITAHQDKLNAAQT